MEAWARFGEALIKAGLDLPAIGLGCCAIAIWPLDSVRQIFPGDFLYWPARCFVVSAGLIGLILLVSYLRIAIGGRAATDETSEPSA